ncbi:MAG TPA: hypothetical protein DGN60_05760 [Chloroflexi bacterium]|nr:hypothetical protein [Chloroflexota bacterium]
MSFTNGLEIEKDDAGIKNALWRTYSRDDIGIWFDVCWWLVFGAVGILLRFHKLGSLPLSDIEVENALLAWLIVDGQELVDTNWLANSALVYFTQIIIFWFTDVANSISARVVTALCGSVLIFTPFLFGRHLGRVGACVMMALFAVSPSLVMISRTADGMAISLVCLVIALLGIESANNLKVRHGIGMVVIGLVLGIMCGRSFVIPVLFIMFILFRSTYLTKQVFETLRTSNFNGVLAYVLIGLLVVTSFFRYRYGFMVLAEPWDHWVLGWSSYSSMHSELMIPEMVFLNQPLLILLAVVGLFISQNARSIERNLLVLAICGLLYGIVYSGVQSRDVVWVIIPLYVVCARVMVWVSQSEWSGHELIVATVEGIILGSLIVFGYIVVGGQEFTLRTADYGFDRNTIIQVLVLVVMLVLVVALFSAGWSARVSMVSVMIILFVFSTVWSIHRSWTMVEATNGAHANNWHKTWNTGSDKLMLKTLGNLSLRYVGHPREVDIKVIGPFNRQLAWSLRDFSNVKWSENPALVSYPSVILTPGLSESIIMDPRYMGQEFQLYHDYYGHSNIVAKDKRNSKSRPSETTFDTIVVWTIQGDTNP